MQKFLLILEVTETFNNSIIDINTIIFYRDIWNIEQINQISL